MSEDELSLIRVRRRWVQEWLFFAVAPWTLLLSLVPVRLCLESAVCDVTNCI